ncbi:PREDICTED: protein HGV2-like isoform X2 [Branchiostoma belcheri]|uniref:Protein HGV2-like isoform X2 n=1 Tax=Branchiostoma belcheri TaxID=7741 RepID=A0A6P4YSI6_BRABE|nr:PREDICTED: protein HGV2-like isoform X2 [Branchiostoma belcheri]
MATDVAAPSTSSGSPSKDLDSEAKDLIGQGRRHLVMGEIPNAVNCFQECCGILAAKYGETADEVGEAYYLYGRSLIELARMETGVLGNALQGVPEESDSEAEEGEDSTVGNPDEVKDTPEQEADTDKKEESDDTKAKDDGKGDADAETKDDGKKDKEPDTKADEKEEKKDEADAEKEDAEDTGKSEEEVSQDEEMETGEDQSEGVEEKDSEKESEKESEASEDVSNLQLAWEVLELARNIYSKKEAKEDRLKLAQIYLHLGEIGLETEKYDQAAEDFMSCLKIQQELLDAEDRLLAESHYQLGLAYSLSKDYDKSIEYYRNSHNVIKSRIGMLQGKIEELETGKGKEPVSSDDPIMVHRKEVEELNALLPEISSKMEDAEEMKKGAEEEARAIMASELGIGAGVSSSSSAAPASTIAVKKAGEGSSSSAEAKPAADISHLVRKKRKPSDEEKADSSSDAKKPRQENGAGDKAEVNGTAVNGTAVNGAATNGAAGTSSTETSPEKDKQQAKITPKTVEDLKKDQESKKDQDTETAAMEMTSS